MTRLVVHEGNLGKAMVLEGVRKEEDELPSCSSSFLQRGITKWVMQALYPIKRVRRLVTTSTMITDQTHGLLQYYALQGSKGLCLIILHEECRLVLKGCSVYKKAILATVCLICLSTLRWKSKDLGSMAELKIKADQRCASLAAVHRQKLVPRSSSRQRHLYLAKARILSSTSQLDTHRRNLPDGIEQ